MLEDIPLGLRGIEGVTLIFIVTPLPPSYPKRGILNCHFFID
jgi:hypothetical protein